MKHPAYHLRTNKAVDRLSWISQVRDSLINERKASFYSLGGPFLEDLKLAHVAFPRLRLISIESNFQTYQRQKFHNFTTRLELNNATIDDYLIHNYEPSDQDFFWLDFTDLSLQRLNSFRSLLTRVPSCSLIRITLRAEPDSTLKHVEKHLPSEQASKLAAEINEKFEKDFSTALSHDTSKTPLCSRIDFARTVQMMVRRVSSEALASTDTQFMHIGTSRYDDGNQMLSVTGMVINRTNNHDLLKHLKAKGISLEPDAWSEPVEIKVPVLSILERHWLDKHLPKRDREGLGKVLLRKLKYQIDEGEKHSEDALRQYAKYYREYPNFAKVNF